MKVKEFIPASSVPKITKFWDFKKNNDVDINMTSVLAQKPLLSWKCKRCGYEWKASVYNRYISKGECPRCEQKKVIWSGHNDAVTLVPGIMDEWDKEKNDAEDIHLENEGVGSKKIAYWKCPICNREFKMAIGNRIRKQKDGTYLFVSCTHKKPENVPMIAEVKKLVDFWDFDENKDIDINTTSVMMKRPSVHWKCKICEFQWTAPVYSRYKAKPECPCCDQGHGVSAGYNDISTILPDALKEWDFDANASEGIDIKKIGVGSKTVVNWKCPVCGRKFRKAMGRRVDKKDDGTYHFIPCQHKDTTKIKPEDKQKVFEVPKLMKFWDKERNTMDPSKTPSNSSKRAYWKCPDCGYEWKTSVSVRLDALDRCPRCGEKRDYSVKKGISDIFTVFPQAKKYYDFDKNNGLDPYSFSYNSKIPLFDWKCPDCGYEWQSSFFGMTGGKTRKSFTGCPKCGVAKESTKENRKNDSVASIYDIPNMMRFWDAERNVGLDPRVIPAGSRKTFFWKCPVCERKWEATAKSRLISGNCPCCDTGTVIVKGVNDVLTVKPEFASLFDFDNNPDIDIYSEGVHSEKLVNFKCKKCGNKWRGRIASRFRYGKDNDVVFIDCQKCSSGHSRNLPYAEEYPQLAEMCDEQASGRSIFSIRTYDDSYIPMTWICPTCKKRYKTSTARIIIALKKGRTGCPYCALIRVKPGESFAEVYPEYLSMWCPNNDKEPDKISYNAASRFYWICPDCGGKYGSTIQDIVSGNAECPYCNNKHVLPGFNSLKVRYPDIAYLWSDENDISADDVFPDSARYVKWVCPTCHGTYGASVRDMVSGEAECPYCNGIKVLPGFNSLKVKYPEIASLWSDENDISADDVFPDSARYVRWVCPTCHGTYGASIRDVVSGEADCPYCNDRQILHGFNSLKDKYPDIAALWSDENNTSADEVLPNYAMSAQWVCPTCHGTFYASIRDMVSGKADCPYCNNRHVLPGFNSLKVKYLDIASWWSDENDISTDDVLPSSPRYVKWICPTCHGTYSASIKDMVSGEADCPYCTGRQVLPGFNSFKIKHPDLMDEWLYLNNSLLADPDQISENYNKKVWWECSQGHHYPMSPAKRIMFQKRHREPCPFCKGRRLKLRHYY